MTTDFSCVTPGGHRALLASEFSQAEHCRLRAVRLCEQCVCFKETICTISSAEKTHRCLLMYQRTVEGIVNGYCLWIVKQLLAKIRKYTFSANSYGVHTWKVWKFSRKQWNYSVYNYVNYNVQKNKPWRHVIVWVELLITHSWAKIG